MKKIKVNPLNRNGVMSFISDNKNVIAAVGGIATGIVLASLLGNERAKQLLKSIGTSLMDMSGKIAEDLGEYKSLLTPLLSKNPAQGL